MSDRGATLLPLVLVACAASASAPTKFSGKSARVDVALETAGSPLQRARRARPARRRPTLGCPESTSGSIVDVFIVNNPDKLARISRDLGPLGGEFLERGT